MENNVNQEVQEPQKKSKKNKIITLVIIILVIFLIGGLAFIEYNVLSKDNDTNDYDNQEEKYTLDVYKDEYGYCERKSEYCNTLAFTVDAESKNAKILLIESNFILYEDNGLKTYDIKNQNIEKINLDEYGEIKNILISDDETKIVGIIYKEKNSEYIGYYNLKLNKKMYENKYTSISKTETEEYLNAYNGGNDKIKSFLLKTDEEKIEIEGREVDSNSCGTFFEVNKVNNKFFYYEDEGCNSFNYEKIYSNEKKVIASNVNESMVAIYKDNLYVLDNNTIKKFDVDGNELKSINFNKDNVKQIINNYVIYIDNDNYLSLMNIDDNNEKKQFVKWDSNKLVYDDFSTYYSKEELDRLGKNTEEGIYLLTYYYNDAKDENGNYGMEYCYTIDHDVKVYPIDHPMGGRAKPVLYLYPTKKTKITVKFAHPEYLMTTYPKYKGKWEVIASPNGDLSDKDNKYYYALYWDEVRHSEVDFKEGFYVTRDNAINFLEEKLTLIGLNAKERNEFIMYWLPILESNKKSLVYFELTKERESNNKLIINPKPDSMLRIAIHIKKVDKKINIKEQKLETFNRYGFSAIEWGGMVY